MSRDGASGDEQLAVGKISNSLRAVIQLRCRNRLSLPPTPARPGFCVSVCVGRLSYLLDCVFIVCDRYGIVPFIKCYLIKALQGVSSPFPS